MIILICAKKAFEKIEDPLRIKKDLSIRNRRALLQHKMIKYLQKNL